MEKRSVTVSGVWSSQEIQDRIAIKKLTSQDVRDLVAVNNLTSQDAKDLLAAGMLNAQNAQDLVAAGKLTQQEIQDFMKVHNGIGEESQIITGPGKDNNAGADNVGKGNEEIPAGLTSMLPERSKGTEHSKGSEDDSSSRETSPHRDDINRREKSAGSSPRLTWEDVNRRATNFMQSSALKAVRGALGSSASPAQIDEAIQEVIRAITPKAVKEALTNDLPPSPLRTTLQDELNNRPADQTRLPAVTTWQGGHKNSAGVQIGSTPLNQVGLTPQQPINVGPDTDWQRRTHFEVGRNARQQLNQEVPFQLAGGQFITGAKEVEQLANVTTQLQQRLLELEKQVHTGSKKTLRGGNPFGPGVMADGLPSGCNTTGLPEYDGTSDPQHHLTRFGNLAILYGYSDGVRCKVFLTTLVRTAQEWASQLPPGSIHSFEQFSTLFLHQFASSKQQPRGNNTLFAVKQREQESLRSYVARFTTACLEVPMATPEVKMSAFEEGLRRGEFHKSLARDPTRSWDELLARAEREVNAEEAEMNKCSETYEKRRERREDSRMQGPHKRPRGIEVRERPLIPVPRFEQYAVLRATPSQTLMQIQNTGLVNWPRGSEKGPRKAPSDRFCRFHNDYGHDTDECRHLRDEIERLIREGYLQELICQDRARGGDIFSRRDTGPQDKSLTWRRPTGKALPWRETATKEPPKWNAPKRDNAAARTPKVEPGQLENPTRTGNQTNRGVIKMISGGPTDGDSHRARRAHARDVVDAELTNFNVMKLEGDSDLPAIQFGPTDMTGLCAPHNDALVITAGMAGYEVERIFIDSGSSVDVLYIDAYRQMNLGEVKMEFVNTALYGFAGETVRPLGIVTLPLTMGTPPLAKTRMIRFLVVDMHSAYNAILGRPSLNTFQAVISTYHMKIKFPVADKIGEVVAHQHTARKCYVKTVQLGDRQDTHQKGLKRDRNEKGKKVTEDSEEKEGKRVHPRVEPSEELMMVELVPGDPSRIARIGAQLEGQLREKMIACLRRNMDVFAWSSKDLVGISPEVVVHKLNVDTSVRPVKQKKRTHGADRDRIIQEEVDKLLQAGHIREIQYPEWLSNVVLVRKAANKWRMCVDFRNLNDACPKDFYPLPNIDQLVDSTSGCELLSMMDAYQGYNQIPLLPEDQKKVAFITAGGTYCYQVMPFGLKNAGATYQRLVDRMFKDQIGRNMEVYVDDMLVKSRKALDHVVDLEEAFRVLRRYNMKLNPEKCSFGVKGGRFLGFLVTERGIEANPTKIKAIQEMRPPTTTNEVQRLTGRIAALSRFISRLAERSLPFFRTLRKATCFEWNEECQGAFEDLKKYLADIPLLVKPVPGEPLYLYLAVTNQAISTVLIREEQGVQKPIYYVSKVLQGAEQRYPEMEKLALALVVSARRLRPYFLSHAVIVRTNHPMKQILGKPEAAGRLVKWAMELGEFDISYSPRTAIKAQALADFLVEMAGPTPQAEHPWLLHVDGSSTNLGSGAGIVLTSPEGDEFEFAVRLEFNASNNEAEYEALIVGMELAIEVGAQSLLVYSDSQLVACQVGGKYEAKEERMVEYLKTIEKIRGKLSSFKMHQIPRRENSKADHLAKLASSLQDVRSRKITVLTRTRVGEKREVLPAQDGPDWREDVFNYLTGGGEQPMDQQDTARLRSKAARFAVIGGILYKKSLTKPLLRCLSKGESEQVLREIHEGSCGNHLGWRTLAQKVLRAGYFWPTIKTDAKDFVTKCGECQRHAPLIHQPGEPLTAMQAPCPFARWGVDIVGPLPLGKGQTKFMIVAVDYFSKWVEAEAVAKITEAEVIKFLRRNIVTRFGIPRELISDNGRQFRGARLRAWCENLGIKQCFSAVCHPQANGQVEVMNKILLHGLKTRVERARGKWAEELDMVLWGYRTTPSSTTGETPFNLVYGTEAVIPAEVGVATHRISAYKVDQNEALMRESLDTIEEARDRAFIRMARYKSRMASAYNRKVKPREFQIGDLVLRRADALKPVGKLGPTWEGPYKVVKIGGRGSYGLEDMAGTSLPRPWNVQNLRKFYS